MTNTGSAAHSSDDVAALLSGRARLQAMLDVEAALAEAEASLNVIPVSAAAAIRAAARAELYDVESIEADARLAGNMAIPLVRQLTKQVADRDEESSRYV